MWMYISTAKLDVSIWQGRYRISETQALTQYIGRKTNRRFMKCVFLLFLLFLSWVHCLILQ